MNNYKLRIMLERALYFYIENTSEEDLKQQFEWYKVENYNVEDLVDIMFESYLDNYSESELIERINDLLLLDNMSIEEKFVRYNKFLKEQNNSDLFELKIGVVE